MQGAYLWVKDRDWRIFLAAVAPPNTLNPGRPNKRNEALELHKIRMQNGRANPVATREAREIHSILVERYKSDPDWSYDVESIAKALRDYKKSA